MGSTGDAEHSLFFHEEPVWNTITSGAWVGAQLPAVQYAKATGRMANGTAFLFGDSAIGTVDHSNWSATWAEFGSYRPDPNIDQLHELFPGSISYARRRLRSLGMSDYNAANVSATLLTRFYCYATHLYNDYDFRDGQCTPNYLPELGWVYPGDIWGHYYLHYVNPEIGVGEHSQAVLNTINRRTNGATYREVLYAPLGSVPDSVDSCVIGEGYSFCFEHTASGQAGSSGSPIFATNGNNAFDVFGVYHGCYAWDDPDCATWDEFFAWGYFTYTNYGAYVPNVIAGPIGGHLTLPPLTSGEWTEWLGGYGGSSKFLYCPANEVAVGVIGTTESPTPHRVANFGLVCSPLESYSSGSRHNQDMHVVVGGSSNTGFVTGVFKFNEYLNETLEDGVLAHVNRQQEFFLCDKGQWMTGIRARSDGSIIQSVQRIYCKDNAGGASLPTPVTPIGTSTNGVFEISDCNNASNAVTGLFIRSGWLTDGFRLYCRNI